MTIKFSKTALQVSDHPTYFQYGVHKYGVYVSEIYSKMGGSFHAHFPCHPAKSINYLQQHGYTV